MPSKQQVLQLYRNMLRNASKFESYNYRNYALRRVKEEFHKNKDLGVGSAEQQAALAVARDQAGMLFRQATVSRMYPPESKSIMETTNA
ncbi:TPA: hypothetical protein N0F65_011541 [Lagenidium giganteum]|uniref:Complex 1 LYR protein domain-containing protein n=1 Tax=Lagenidium giganteum TaxID=4803 RepID=A0AAV2Z745_9STRA|nr:TPA: hypothetical protein N0F65_011541 [Lagenidium giganteum]